MSRLTKKDETVLGGYSLVASALGSDIMAKSLSKFGTLEDIEEELGIDLITLFKAVKQGYIYRKVYRTERCIDFDIVKEDFDLFIFEDGRKSNNVLRFACLGKIEEIGNNKQCYQYLNDISAYGKWWALTKEELE